MYTQDTPLSQLTVSQFQDLLLGIKKHQQQEPDAIHDRYVYGIGGLARLINSSNVTAQKLKSSGKIPYRQVGRKIVFEKDAVLKALNEGGRP
jgi:hypothetical protein